MVFFVYVDLGNGFLNWWGFGFVGFWVCWVLGVRSVKGCKEGIVVLGMMVVIFVCEWIGL